MRRSMQRRQSRRGGPARQDHGPARRSRRRPSLRPTRRQRMRGRAAAKPRRRSGPPSRRRAPGVHRTRRLPGPMRTAKARRRGSGSASARLGEGPRARAAPRPQTAPRLRLVRHRLTDWPPYRSDWSVRWESWEPAWCGGSPSALERVGGGVMAALPPLTSSSLWKSGIHSALPAASRALSAASRGLFGQVVAHLPPRLGSGQDGDRGAGRGTDQDAQEERGPVALLAALPDAGSYRGVLDELATRRDGGTRGCDGHLPLFQSLRSSGRRSCCHVRRPQRMASRDGMARGLLGLPALWGRVLPCLFGTMGDVVAGLADRLRDLSAALGTWSAISASSSFSTIERTFVDGSSAMSSSLVDRAGSGAGSMPPEVGARADRSSTAGPVAGRPPARRARSRPAGHGS